MSTFAVNFHKPPCFAALNVFCGFLMGIVGFLYVFPRHTYFIEVLYFVVAHIERLAGVYLDYKRVKHKSNAVLFHMTKGGAVPTYTHQNKELSRNV